jgi:hypothetical protein
VRSAQRIGGRVREHDVLEARKAIIAQRRFGVFKVGCVDRTQGDSHRT